MLREPIEHLISDPRELTANVPFPRPEDIRLYDETLRDGEQMPGVCYTPSQKLEIAKAISSIGVHIMSVGFPAASEGDRITLQLLLDAKRKGQLGDVELVVMCRSAIDDIDLTIQSVRDAGASPSDVTFLLFTSASDLHLKYKIGKTLLRSEGMDESRWLDTPIAFYREANTRMQCAAIRYAIDRGVTNIEFGAEDASRANIDYIIDYYNAGFRAGAIRGVWADTVGCLTPEATRWFGKRIIQGRAMPVPMAAHFHNDYGLGTINAITATTCGFDVISVTVNGYGERAGNVKLHEYVVALHSLYGIRLPGFRYDKLRDLARLLERMSGVPIPQHEPIVGTGVFTHESGIHTHGVMIDRRMYEAVPGELVAAETSFVFGKHSGAKLIEDALKRNEHQLAKLGIAVTPRLVRTVMSEVKRLNEERSASGANEKMIAEYYGMLNERWMREEDVVALSASLAQADTRPTATAGFA